MLDVIIPVYNEEKILLQKKDYYQSLRHKARVIFVDGGSTDRTVEIAKNFGEVIASERGRALQMNKGVQISNAEYILFLHVDTYIYRVGALDKVTGVLSNGICGGCFTMNIEDSRRIFRIFEWIVNFRAKYWGVMDGDLGLFVKRSVFDNVGQFDSLPIMEDILFSKKLRKEGKWAVLPDRILVSSRKWDEKGFLKTFVQYCRAYVGFWFKLPLGKEYNRARKQ